MQFPATLVFGGKKAHPTPGWGKNFFYTGSIHFMQFPATLVFVAEKVALPGWQGNFFYTASIHFKQFPATLVFGSRKAPPPFLNFSGETWLTSFYMWNTHGPHYYKSTLRFLLSKYLLLVTNFINFSKYSHIEKSRTQDYGAGGSPVGSLTTIHTNIPAIPITLLAMALWNVIRLFYVYAYISLSGYMTKLLVILLQQLRSIEYEAMLKINILQELGRENLESCDMT